MKKKIGIMILSVAMILSGCQGTTDTEGITNALSQAITGNDSTSVTTSTETNTSDVNDLVGGEVTLLNNDEFLESYFIIDEEDAVVQTTGTLVELNNADVTLSAPGTYLLQGTIEDGQIIVDASDDDIITLILSGVDITSSDSSPIYVKNAKKVVITLAEGTTNHLEDGTTYVYESTDVNEPNATIFSHDDLTINGLGELIITANYNDGIKSKDKLLLMSGDISILAAGDGIVGKDRLIIGGGTYEITAEGSGLKTSNGDEEGKGILGIIDGDISLTTKADGIHSDNAVYILGGNIIINAEDDGVHSEKSLAIYGGTMDVQKSYEGLESQLILIEDGTINLVTSDDGVNVTNGTSSEGPNSEVVTASMDYALIINGGTLYVNAGGDGLDSNGSMYITGGIITVDGPTQNNNGPLDCNGVIEITGGLLTAVGSSGMAEAPAESSSQLSVMMTYPMTMSPGTLVTLKNEEGSVIATYAPSKNFQSVLFSSPDLVKGGQYTLETQDSTAIEFVISGVVTWLNESGITTQATNQFGGGKGDGSGRTKPTN